MLSIPFIPIQKEANSFVEYKSISTCYGRIRGKVEADVVSFKGIPFATPPVGSLRFLPPLPPAPWDDVLDCMEYKNSAVQKSLLPTGINYSEDCLYLNLWMPSSKPDNALPVLVFIHGGGFAKGSPSKKIYEGIHFAQNGVIQVNITYRLNALGFMGFKEVEQTSGSFGNNGLLDQIAALQWVQQNIASFGGDPKSVTICGESSGAFSVSSLILSPLAKGLFSKAILESGNLLGQPVISPVANGTKEQAIRLSHDFMRFFKAKSLEEMQQIPASKLAVHSDFKYNMVHPPKFNFWPVFDGHVLPINPFNALKDGKHNHVDILAGFNTDESTIFVSSHTNEQDYNSMVNAAFGKQAVAYRECFPIDAMNSPLKRARELIQQGFQFGNEIFAQILSEQGQKAYLYHFDYDIPVLDKIGLGTMHALELVFVFDTIPELLLNNKELAEFMNTIHNYWLNFVIHGNPNQGNTVPEEWLPYSNKNKNIILLNNNIQIISSQYYKEAEFINHLLWS